MERFFNLLVPFSRSGRKTRLQWSFSYQTRACDPLEAATKFRPRHTRSMLAPLPATFALQASLMGWYVHGIIGFDADRAFEELSAPKGCTVEAVYAVGRIADPAGLPEELRTRDVPSNRRSLGELAFEGGFPQ